MLTTASARVTPAVASSAPSSAASPWITSNHGLARRRWATIEGSTSIPIWREPGASLHRMASLIDPVPGPSSTTTGVPEDGTTAVSALASDGELGATAPTTPCLRTAIAMKALRSALASLPGRKVTVSSMETMTSAATLGAQRERT
ncbi:hypothetical protein GCM10022224_098060 [Nonomuraea antimicrobica]|uniref:Uncharacterized protein n=1 Tax=Nonomuraea antimicrobica TaxID=561173 RepID=A0ABP7EB31_9ACTN